MIKPVTLRKTYIVAAIAAEYSAVLTSEYRVAVLKSFFPARNAV